MRKLLIALLSLSLGTISLYGQKPLRLSLDQCTEYAIANSAAMKNAHLDLLIQQAKVKQTAAAAYPHINGKADLSYAYIVQSQFIDASTFATPSQPVPKGTIIPVQFTLPYAGSASITTSQLLFDGSVLVALQAGNTVLELARRSQNATAEAVRYNVHKSYNALVIANKQYDIIRNSLTLAREMQSDLEKTRDAGFAEKIDVDRTSVQINNLATDSIKVSNMLVLAEQVLKYQMGMDINTPIVLTDTSVEAGSNSLLSLTSLRVDYENLPQYGVLQTALKLNEFDLKRYRLSALPSLNAFWAYGNNYGTNKVEDIVKTRKYAPSSLFGVSLTAPIFNGFVRQHQVSEARLNIRKTQNDLDNMKLTIDFQAANARTSLRNSLLQVQSQKRNLELSNSVLDLAQKKYKAGVGSNLEVTTAQTDLLRAQNNYFSSLLDLMNAEADLKKALGMMK